MKSNQIMWAKTNHSATSEEKWTQMKLIQLRMKQNHFKWFKQNEISWSKADEMKFETDRLQKNLSTESFSMDVFSKSMEVCLLPGNFHSTRKQSFSMKKWKNGTGPNRARLTTKWLCGHPPCYWTANLWNLLRFFTLQFEVAVRVKLNLETLNLILKPRKAFLCSYSRLYC